MASRPDFSHTWMPAYVPKHSLLIALFLIYASLTNSTTLGYDGSMLNGLNILPSYTDYFHLNDALTGLQTASVFIGGVFTPVWGPVTNQLGRRPALFWAALITCAGVVLQAAAQNITMFVIARIILGFGTGAGGLSASVYLAETLPMKWRAWGIGLLNDGYYVGGLIAAGITYGTAKLDSTWAWRIPSIVQGIFSIISIIVLPFVPESPRWLVYAGYREDALAVVAQTYANGDASNPIVATAFKEIVDTLDHEKNVGETLSLLQVFRTRSALRRITLACSAAVFSTIAGNVIASYYLGQQLTQAGIKDTTTQLEVNVYLNVWSLFCAVAGTALLDGWGRKSVGVASQVASTAFLFLVGGLTKAYGASTNKSGIYGTVAAVFLFQGAYSFGWTPLLTLYPPEVLNYSVRANGVGIVTFVGQCTAVLIVYTMPIALDHLGWKTYMVNGAWDCVTIVLMVVYWVETKGRTLEEIDAIFEGQKFSNVPDLVQVYEGKADAVKET